MWTEKSIVLHPFSDLSQTRPLFFICNLKKYSIDSESRNVEALRQLIIEALPGAPPPGPFTFLMDCINVLYFLYEARCCGVLWHFLASVLCSLDELGRTSVDDSKARKSAAKLIGSAIGSVRISEVLHINEGMLVKLATVFKIENNDLEEAAYIGGLHSKISEAFLETVSRPRPRSQAQDGDIKKKLRMFSGKRLWNFAENIAAQRPELVDFLVNLALEMGNAQKAAEICRRCCRTTFCSGEVQEVPVRVHEIQIPEKPVPVSEMHKVPEKLVHEMHKVPEKPVRVDEIRNLELEELVSEENVIWVDTNDGLTEAKRHFAQVEVVGIDSEWIETSQSSRRYKVSILQIASEEKVFIFDLLKLAQTESDADALEDCLKPLFHSPQIWKVGYALNNDFKQLYGSYGYFDCFTFCAATLDFQRIYPYAKGGLSGLTEELLNRRLDKSFQMSDWGKRPLSRSQMQYAALDAAVLIAIFKVTQNTQGSCKSYLRSWEA